MGNYCLATYRCFDDKADFQKKALGIAVGLTVGSWTDLPESKKSEMEKHLGKVVSVTVNEPSSISGLGSENHRFSQLGIENHRFADICIAYPDLNFSSDLPALLVTVFGKLSMDGKIKLMDLSFSEHFLQSFRGPKFGIQGVRKLLGVTERPLLMSIFKSVIGYDLPALREQFLLQALGGVDLIKDDEILFENPLSPLEKRAEACMAAALQAQRETGQKLLYAVNLTGPSSKLAVQAKKAINAGANALLFNVLAYGFDVLHELSRDEEITVPIAAHPALAGAFYPSPFHGMSASLLLGKLMRMAGADLVLFPSPYGSVVMPKEDNMAIKDALLTEDIETDYVYHAIGQNPLTGPVSKPILTPSFPVPSAGIHPGLVPLILKDFGRDVIVNAGGGVHGHPMGASAGGRAFRQAIDAALAHVPLREYASNHEELQAAINIWGVKEHE